MFKGRCILFSSTILALALAVVLHSHAWAQTTELVNDLPIDTVTVYPRSAIVTRSGEVNIPAGTSTLVLENLPQGLDPARLQLSIADGSVQFGNLQLQENFQSQTTNERENTLRDLLQSLQDERQVIIDRIDTAQSELALLGNLTGGDNSGVRPTLNGSELEALIDVVSTNSAQARERIRNANIELRELDEQIAQRQFELDQVATAQSVYNRLQIQLRADNATSTQVSLAYPQNDASWTWLYEARLDTAARELSLFRRAAVVQGTGEDWNNVALTLSTANPFTNTRTPELNPLFVDIARPQPQLQRSRAGSAAEMMVEDSVTVTANPAPAFEPVTTVDTRYQLDYVIPGRVNLAADRQQQVMPVDQNSFSVNLVSRTVPSLDARAYLEARFDFTGDSPVQSARMQLYRDNAYIGDSRSPEFLPGQTIRIPFGVDQRVEVERFDEKLESGSTGLFNRGSVREERIRYEITSRHPEDVQIELLDRVPVPRSADINVNIPRQATAADETDFGGEAGILMWRLDVAPQQTTTVRHYYDIRYPGDEDISFQ